MLPPQVALELPGAKRSLIITGSGLAVAPRSTIRDVGLARLLRRGVTLTVQREGAVREACLTLLVGLATAGAVDVQLHGLHRNWPSLLLIGRAVLAVGTGGHVELRLQRPAVCVAACGRGGDAGAADDGVGVQAARWLAAWVRRQLVLAVDVAVQHGSNLLPLHRHHVLTLIVRAGLVP